MESFEQNVSEATAHNIRMKAFLYWELWEEFSLCLQRVHELYAMALLELPRGCDYWNDERMKFMVNDTESTVHEFDGCMYGLKLHNSKMPELPSRNHGESYRGRYHFLICIRSVMAHILMDHVQVERLVLPNFTQTKL